MVAPLGVDLGRSFDSFQHGAQEFFHRLSEIAWPAMVIALLFYFAHLLARSRAWQNVLRAAYPDRKVPLARITAAYLVGAGMNSVVPARIGDAVKIFLAKRSIRRSTYPTVVSSFFVGSVFDTSAGILVFIYALTQGLLPKPPELPDLPAFDIAFWAQHPDFLVFTLTALAIAVVVAFALECCVPPAVAALAVTRHRHAVTAATRPHRPLRTTKAPLSGYVGCRRRPSAPMIARSMVPVHVAPCRTIRRLASIPG